MQTPRARAILTTSFLALSLGLAPVATQPQASAAPAASLAAGGSKDLYVSPRGDDSQRGSAAQPVRTISQAVRLAPSGARILVASGSYHESVVVQGKSNLTIAAHKGARVWLDGSRSVGGWRASGDDWVSTGWKPEFDSTPTLTGRPDTWGFINPSYPMAAHPDQVWVGGQRLRQVGSRGAVSPGAFYVDDARDRLYIGTNPSNREVRASDLSKAMSIRAPGTTVSGINARRYATAVPQMGTVTVERPGVRLSDLIITDNATSGLQIGSPNVSVTRVQLKNNGMIGLRANQANNLKLNRVKVFNNNIERFNFAPSAGGAKITRTRLVTVRNSTFRRNHGTGLWFDESVYAMRVYGSRVLDNKRHGMSLEISGRAVLANNLIAGNTDHGIKINNTDRVQVWNNTLVRNGRQINIVQDDRDVDIGRSFRNWSLPLTLRSSRIKVRNNIMAETNARGNCLLCVEDHSHRFSAKKLRIRTKGNFYHRVRSSRPSWLIVWSAGKGNPDTFKSLRAFKRKKGQKKAGRAVVSRRMPLNSKYRPGRKITSVQRSVATPLPRGLAKRIGRRPGSRHLGSWVTR